MNHLYSYRYRLMPTPEQQVLLAKHFGCVRYVYNHFLAQRIQKYRNTKEGSTSFKDQKQLAPLKNTLPWMKEVGCHSLQCAIKNLQAAYENFFRKCNQKVKGKKGFPRFKKKTGKQSFRVPQGARIINDKLVLPKFLGGIPMVLHRPCEGEIKFATVSKNHAGQYHVSVTVEKEIVLLPESDQVVGLDLNVKYVVDNNGSKTPNPRPELKYKSRLKLLAQRVSRAVKGSKNRAKAWLKYAKLKQHVHNIREDFLHKLSRRIINENQVVCVEDLSVEDMVRKVSSEEMPRWKQKKLHRDVLDCGFYSLVSKLAYKALWYGRTLVKVSRWYPSSQICHKCGWRNKDLQPHEREWGCLNCFEMNDRDLNAAENVLEEGMRIRTSGTEELAYCPDVRPAHCGLLVG